MSDNRSTAAPVVTTVGTEGSDALAAQAEGDRVDGRGGDDRLASQFNWTLLIGGGGGDRLVTDLHFGGPGSTLEADAAQEGGAGDDRMTLLSVVAPGDAEFATVRNHALGGDGADIVRAEASVSGFAVSGEASNDLGGGAGDDEIRALASGAADMDYLSSVLAANRIRGGDGDDRVKAEVRSLPVDVAGGENRLWGGTGNDTLEAEIYASANSVDPLANMLDGGAGSDLLVATSFQSTNHATGTATNTFFGRGGADALHAEATSEGDDGLTDLANVIHGGSGDDWATALVRVSGGDGAPSDDARGINRMFGGAGNDDLAATVEVDGGYAVEAVNVVDGGEGDDNIYGSASAWLVYGDPGEVEAARNRLLGGAGDDTIHGAIAEGRRGLSVLEGGGGDDSLSAEGGRGNILRGGGGDDTISGSEARDRIVGGGGDDLVFGGGGADHLVFDLERPLGTDTIGDFDRSADVLVFRGLQDKGAPGAADDLDAAIAGVEDMGDGQAVRVTLGSGSVLVFEGLGTGSVDEVADLVEEPAIQLVAEGASLLA
jgi:serralysin